MARRDALLASGGFATDLRMSQDWDMWLRLAQHGRVAFSNEVEALYTVRAGSLSGDAQGRARYNGEVLQRHFGFAVRHKPTAALAGLSFVEVARAEKCRAEDHDGAAWAHYLAAFLACPSIRHARDFRPRLRRPSRPALRPPRKSRSTRARPRKLFLRTRSGFRLTGRLTLASP